MLQPNPQDLNLKELRDLFLVISRTFVENLQSGKIDDLKAIQHYMRQITDEIEQKELHGSSLLKK